MKLSFIEKNNFVVQHASAEYFEKDKALFIKTFPHSPLIPSLQMVNQFNAKQLDERILLELLENVCCECILENRGIIADFGLSETEAQALVLNNDIESLDIEILAKVCKALKLTASDDTLESFIEAITIYLAELNGADDATIQEAKKIVIDSDIETLDRKTLMFIANTLKLETEDFKNKTLIAAIDKLKTEWATPSITPAVVAKGAPTGDVVTDASDDKKKEVHE